MGKRFPEALWRADAPFDVQFHHSPSNRFPPDMPDDEWLAIVGAKGWFAFSHDRRWRKDQLSLLAIKQFQIGCFYLWGGEVTTWDKVCFFVKHWQKIMEAAKVTPRPFAYYLTKTGQLEKVSLDDIKSTPAPNKQPAIRAVR